jgi:hypothetical protein
VERIALRDLAVPREVLTARVAVEGVRASLDESDDLTVNDARLTHVYRCNQLESSAR